MKIQIRQGVFETNSSSVHTLTWAKKDLHGKWRSGQAYLMYNQSHGYEDAFGEIVDTDLDVLHSRRNEIVKKYNDETDEYFGSIYDIIESDCIPLDIDIPITYDEYISVIREWGLDDYEERTPDNNWVAFGGYGMD